jgi:hypothetical protein
MKQGHIDRFWKRVTKTPTCWEWIRPTHPFGYGILNVDGKQELAHRVSYKMHYGPITSKDCVLHKCDNPKCVNPSHLFIGSRAMNAVDRTLKGRTLRGSSVPNSKLIEQQVLDIRASSESAKLLSKQYGVSEATIYSIRSRGIWRHI